MKKGETVIIDRDWSSYQQGTCFTVVAEVPCGPVAQADGTEINPINLRVVLEGCDVNEFVQHRTIPAEYAIKVPEVNEGDTINANQGDRDAWVIATHGTQVLYEYEMPGGKTFLRVTDLLKPGWFRAVSRNNLPKKWQQELAA